MPFLLIYLPFLPFDLFDLLSNLLNFFLHSPLINGIVQLRLRIFELATKTLLFEGQQTVMARGVMKGIPCGSKSGSSFAGSY